MSSINIIFPVLNEERRIERGINETVAFMRENIKIPFQLNIVDNGSEDQTESISKELCIRYPEVHYTKVKERGLGVAFREGVKINTSDIVGYMDIDLATNLKHLVEVQELFAGDRVDFVNGSRFNKRSKVTGRKWYRNITSYGLLFLLHVVLKMRATDAICGFKFFKKDIAEKLISESSKNENGWFFIIEMLLRAERTGIVIYELPVEWFDDSQTTVKFVETIKNYVHNIWRLHRIFNK